jgi:hypothetical protein
MGQHHVARDKLFVDYLGKRVDIIVDPSTDVVRDAELFVGVLGASSYTYAEATFTQTLADWIGTHMRMFRFFGGVPRLVVPERPVRSRVHGAPAAASSTAHTDSVVLGLVASQRHQLSPGLDDALRHSSIAATRSPVPCRARSTLAASRYPCGSFGKPAPEAR